MQTERDAEIVGWLGRIGAASAEDVMARFGMGRSWAYARLSSLVRDGLLEQKTLLHRRPALYLATAEGLRWTLQPHLPVYRLSPGSFEHAAQLASVAVALHHTLPAYEQLSERELRARESQRGALIASVKLGDLPGGRPALHRPDLALVAANGHTLAVEVELSVKAAPRLRAICRGYARARHVDRVYYLATRPAARAISGAIEQTRTEDRITVFALADIAALSQIVSARRGARDV